MTTAIYTRTARANDAGLQAQRAACADLANRIGAAATQARAATGSPRLALDGLRDYAAAAGRFDSLVVASHDRLARTAGDLADLLDDLDSAGIAVYVATAGDEPVGPASQNSFLLRLMAVVDEAADRLTEEG
ncbi:MAG: recombinase family protein [Nocardioides sp.]|uniref:recombinase family protein n=1 Tax=Nocardioides sp. TaxID=35761 RepID=UPI0039E3F0E0